MTSSGVSKLSYKDKAYVVKILNIKYPYIQQKNEIEGTRIASKLEIGPNFVYGDPEATILVTRFIKARSITQNDLKNPKIVTKLGKLLKKLHACKKEPFSVRTYLDRARKHYDRIQEKKIMVPSKFDQFYQLYKKEEQALIKQDQVLWRSKS